MTKLVGALVLLATGLFLAWLLAGPEKVKADEATNICGTPQVVMSVLNKYREFCDEPVEIAGKQVLYCKNELTGTWSMVVVHKRALCIIGVGRDRRPST